MWTEWLSFVSSCLTGNSGFGGNQELEGQNPVNFWENDLEDKHRFCTRQVPGKGGLVDLVQILLFRTAQLCTGAKLISLSWLGRTDINNFCGKILKKGKALVQNFQVPMTVINVAVAVAEHSSPRSQWNSVVDSLCVPPPWSCSTALILSLSLARLWI